MEVENIRYFLTICMLLCAIGLAMPSQATAETPADSGIQIYINGLEWNAKDRIQIKDERIFVPIRALAEQLRSKVVWNEAARQIQITTPIGDQIQFTLNRYTMKLNGKQYVIKEPVTSQNNMTLYPLRKLVGLFHAKVTWDTATHSVHVQTVPLYTVGKGQTLQWVSDQFQVSKAQLAERNGISQNTELEIGQVLKGVVPSVILDKAKNNEMYLLAKVIDLEAGYEPYKGQIAVGDVILNRVEDERFPDTIREVIFASGQFPPVHQDKFKTLVPKNSCILAAKAALGGKNVVEGALYFYDPNVTSSTFFTSLDVVASIGSHRFVK